MLTRNFAAGLVWEPSGDGPGDEDTRPHHLCHSRRRGGRPRAPPRLAATGSQPAPQQSHGPCHPCQHPGELMPIVIGVLECGVVRIAMVNNQYFQFPLWVRFILSFTFVIKFVGDNELDASRHRVYNYSQLWRSCDPLYGMLFSIYEEVATYMQHLAAQWSLTGVMSVTCPPFPTCLPRCHIRAVPDDRLHVICLFTLTFSCPFNIFIEHYHVASFPSL